MTSAATRPRVRRASTSSNVGKAQERMIANYAKTAGFPFADRTIRTGAGKAYAYRADQGDIWLAPGGPIVQSKRLSPVNRMERAIPKWLAQTEAQRIAAAADVALLIVRREGTTDIGDWWCFWRLGSLKDTHLGYSLADYSLAHDDVPVRLFVRDAFSLLRAAGYGEPLPDAEEATA